MSAILDAMTPHPDPPRQRGREISAPEAVAALVASLPVPQRLRDAGVPEAVLGTVAAEAAGNSTVQANPKPVTEADIVELLRSAW
jgi:alcohol dehydrogenase class IV